VLVVLGACGDNLTEPITGEWVDYGAAASGPPHAQDVTAVICDGTTDTRAAVQAAINAGGLVQLLPGGVCAIAAPSAGAVADLVLPLCPVGETCTLDCAGSTLLQAPGQPPSARLIDVSGAGWTIRNCVLDGNAAAQPLCALTKNGVTSQVPCEHRAGVFGRAPVTIEFVTSHNSSGDGFSLYTGTGYVLDHVTAIGNLRDGFSCVGNAGGIAITNSTFTGNTAQQVDLEPATCNDVTLRDSLLDGAGASSDYVLAIAHGDRFVADHNVINGPIDIVHSHGVVLERNIGTNTTTSSNVLVYEDSDARLTDNTFTATVARSVVQVTGISVAGAQPSATLIGNTLTSNGTAALVYAQGAGTITLTGNTLNCTTAGLAVMARSSLPTFSFQRVEMRDNAIAGCARAIAVSGIGGTATVGQLIMSGNSAGTATSIADDGTGALQFALVDAPILRWPVGAVLTATTAGTMMTRP